MGTRKDSFGIYPETCPIMDPKFGKVFSIFFSVQHLLSDEEANNLAKAIESAQQADSEIRHKFRDLHVDALNELEQLKQMYDNLDETVNHKNNEIRDLQSNLDDKKKEIEVLEDSAYKLEEDVKRLQKEINTTEFA